MLTELPWQFLVTMIEPIACFFLGAFYLFETETMFAATRRNMLFWTVSNVVFLSVFLWGVYTVGVVTFWTVVVAMYFVGGGINDFRRVLHPVNERRPVISEAVMQKYEDMANGDTAIVASAVLTLKKTMVVVMGVVYLGLATAVALGCM